MPWEEEAEISTEPKGLPVGLSVIIKGFAEKVKFTQKPKNLDELEALINSGDIEVMLQEDLDDGTTRLLICDHRRTYEEGEIYEVVI